MDISPTQDDMQVAIRTGLLGILPAGVDVIIGIQNRVPEPAESRFVIMSPLRIQRLRTNIDTEADVKFTGSIAAAVMTVTAVAFGTILNGATVSGVSVAANTKVVAQLTGTPGGAGTYTVSVAQTLTAQTLSTGGKTLEQGAQITVQLDFHSADNTAADLAQTVSTALRDPFGVELFAGTGITPLFADDPRNTPFINENSQAEWRWVLEAAFQVNQAVLVPQQFADAVTVEVISVAAAFP